MKKHLNKMIKIKGMQFYFTTPENEKLWHYDNIKHVDNARYLTQVKSKNRLKQLMTSYLFLSEISSMYTNHEQNFTVIVRGRK
jgi:hypothetical protein